MDQETLIKNIKIMGDIMVKNAKRLKTTAFCKESAPEDLKAQAEIMRNEMMEAYNKFKYWCEWNGYVYMPEIERKCKHATRN